MFKKLRNRFVIINMTTTLIVILVAFTSIYFVADNSFKERGPRPERASLQSELPDFVDSDDAGVFNKYMNEQLRTEHQASMSSLLISLIVTGVAVELVVCGLSFILAEDSIKPVKKAYNSQKDFIANASHEIKTPLAVIQANLEAADIKNNKWIDNIAVKTEELASLNSQLLSLARLESGAEKVSKTKIMPKKYFAEIFEPYQPSLKQKKLTVDQNELTAESLEINEPALRQILNILIDNAVKYSDKKVTAKLTNSSFCIANDGATIPADKLEHIFERFYQTDKTSPGVGLGLSIAKQLAEQNDWTLDAKSSKSKTEFILKF